MMYDAFFRISIIDGALNICRHRNEYPEIAIGDVVRQLQNGPAYLAGYDYNHAIRLGEMVGWDAFHYEGERHLQLQETLSFLAKRLKPFWASVSYLGYRRVLEVASEDLRQCLEFAGLINEPLTSVLSFVQ